MGLLTFIRDIQISYLFRSSVVRFFKGANCKVASSARISNSKIVVSSGADLQIGENVVIRNAELYVEKGSLIIADFSIISSNDKNRRVAIIINDGRVEIDNHSKISCDKIWVRFGGALSIGSYTNVNRGSEIRCDERIKIGSYNQISYNVRIWDTNTHNILKPEQRREIARRYYPYFGYEKTRPKTKPVEIGDDCWIGENAAILKGTTIGNGGIVGFNTTLTGVQIPPNHVAVQDISIKTIELKHI